MLEFIIVLIVLLILTVLFVAPVPVKQVEIEHNIHCSLCDRRSYEIRYRDFMESRGYYINTCEYIEMSKLRNENNLLKYENNKLESKLRKIEMWNK